MRPLWVFGYGSLVWSPGFAWSSRHLAVLRGYRRSFCMLSIHHRGTEERPGLVLALDATEEGECHGVAFEIAPQIAEETLEYLRARELISAAYLEETHPLTLEDGRQVEAVVYVIDREHRQYRGDLSLEEQAQRIAGAVGGRGPNCEYLHQTAAHLAALGLPDAELEWLSDRVKVLKGT
ncbi:MAG: gamma-glutamylcyclotransferase [Rhodobacteraceae bacterium]|nr:gamma-glutamylcyclotransferase [Paracoccaceae bacterium]